MVDRDEVERVRRAVAHGSPTTTAGYVGTATADTDPDVWTHVTAQVEYAHDDSDRPRPYAIELRGNGVQPIGWVTLAGARQLRDDLDRALRAADHG